jgi:two-component system, cell cycle sensor histidine kinase and response regulator CckA
VATRIPGPAGVDRVRALEDQLAAAERHAAELSSRLADSEKRYRSFIDVLDSMRGANPLTDMLGQLEALLRGVSRESPGNSHFTPERGADGAGVAMGTVLLVAEQNSARLLAHRTLQDAGYKVLLASSGAEAVILAEHAGVFIDVLLTDLAMPDMSGTQLADRLARIQPDLRVLFLPGNPPAVREQPDGAAP